MKKKSIDLENMDVDIRNAFVANSAQVYTIMQEILKREYKVAESKELFWVIALSFGHIENIELVAIGNNSSVALSPVDILSVPLQKQARELIFVHNHPGGNLMPSEPDKKVTQRYIKLCKMMNISFRDHLIITENSYYSFRDSELLERLEDNMKFALPWDIEKEAFEEMQKELKKRQRKHNRELKKLEEENKNKVSEHLQEGIQAGMQVRDLEIARNLLHENMDVSFVAKATGLDTETITKLKQDKA